MVCSDAIFNYVTMADSGVINSGHEPNSVQSLLQCPFERTFGRKTEGKGAGSRSAWRFDLLWRFVCEIVCCASVPQPHLKKNSPAATDPDQLYHSLVCELLSCWLQGTAEVSENRPTHHRDTTSCYWGRPEKTLSTSSSQHSLGLLSPWQ